MGGELNNTVESQMYHSSARCFNEGWLDNFRDSRIKWTVQIYFNLVSGVIMGLQWPWMPRWMTGTRRWTGDVWLLIVLDPSGTFDTINHGVLLVCLLELGGTVQFCLFSQLQSFLGRKDLATMVGALVTTKLDYCNALSMGLPLKTVWNYNWYRMLWPDC